MVLKFCRQLSARRPFQHPWFQAACTSSSHHRRAVRVLEPAGITAPTRAGVFKLQALGSHFPRRDRGTALFHLPRMGELTRRPESAQTWIPVLEAEWGRVRLALSLPAASCRPSAADESSLNPTVGELTLTSKYNWMTIIPRYRKERKKSRDGRGNNDWLTPEMFRREKIWYLGAESWN